MPAWPRCRDCGREDAVRPVWRGGVHVWRHMMDLEDQILESAHKP